MRQIIDAVYMTVEADCGGCENQVLVWVTSHAKKTSEMQWWPRPAKREDGFAVLDKKDDEAYMLIFREDDGRIGTMIWPCDPKWTKDELNVDVQRHIDGLLNGTMGKSQ
jgi:hypothetical protein